MDALEKYVHDFSEPEEELLHELDRETNLRAVAPRMISGHIQGRLLEMLVRMLRPRRALEIGTFTGYSALSMAAGLEEEAELHTVEVTTSWKSSSDRISTAAPTAAKSVCISARRSTSPRNWAANSTSCSSTATNANIRPITGC